MAMSREIPINVHPEYRRQQTTSEEQGKPRIFTRSSSLPSGPKLKLVMETLNRPSGARKGQASKAEHEKAATECPRQGTNGTKRNQNYKFWKSSLPRDLYPKIEYLSEHGPCEQNAREGREQRRHFFTENPFVEDLEKVFENQYASASKRRPVKLGRRNTFGAGSSRDTHQSAPKIGKNSSGGNKKDVFFNVPVQVEFNEIKDGNYEIKDGNYENEKKDLIENKVDEKDNIHGEEQTTKPVSEVDTGELQNHNTFRIQVINEPCDVSYDGIKDCNTIDKEQVLDELNSDGNEDTAREINEGKANTELGQIVINIQDDEQFSEDNEGKNKLSTIQSILKKAEGLEKEVDAFADNSKTKEYLTLEEVLTCCLIELDGIETNRDETIRLARKTAVQQLQKTLVRLEQKVSCKAVQNNEEELKDKSSKLDHSLEKECKNSNENV